MVCDVPDASHERQPQNAAVNRSVIQGLIVAEHKSSRCTAGIPETRKAQIDRKVYTGDPFAFDGLVDMGERSEGKGRIIQDGRRKVTRGGELVAALGMAG